MTKASRKTRRQPKYQTPQFEVLESRLLLAGNVTATVKHGSLMVLGDESGNAVRVSPSGDNTYTIAGEVADGQNTTVNGQSGITVSGVQFDVQVFLSGGNDRVVLNDVTAQDDIRVRDRWGTNVVEISGATVWDDLGIRTGRGADQIFVVDSTVGDRLRIRAGRRGDFVCVADTETNRLRVRLGRGGDELHLSGVSAAERARLNGGRGTDILADDDTNALSRKKVKRFEQFEEKATCGPQISVNNSPILDPIGDKVTNEEQTLTFTVTATDPDSPRDSLTYSIDAAAPDGIQLDSATGRFTWTPDETQGPGNYPMTVRVRDNGTPQRDDSETITITVREVNEPPQLNSIGNRSILQGNLLNFAASATDPDVPSGTLRFSLDAATPVGAQIDPASGVFSWSPTEPGTFPVSVRVTDDGNPPLSDFETVNITVDPCTFQPGLPGWTVAQSGGSAQGMGGAAADNCAAVMIEGDSFTATLERSFIVPATDAHVTFTYADPNFDTTNSTSIHDAFEVAVLDASGNPLVPTFVASRDAFFNITESLPAAFGSATTVSGNDVAVDLSAVPEGTQARLVFRLVNNDGDHGTTVTITSVDVPDAVAVAGGDSTGGSSTQALSAKAVIQAQIDAAAAVASLPQPFASSLPSSVLTSSASSENPFATVVQLSFDSLPSAQGWRYTGNGSGGPESAAFSVNGTTLFQDSLGDPLGLAANDYRFDGVGVADEPFRLELRTRVLEDTGLFDKHWGFQFWVTGGSYIAGVSLGPHDIQNPRSANFFVPIDSAIDNTVFHNYRLEGTLSIGTDLFVDDTFVGHIAPDSSSLNGTIGFGDGTGSTNARAELTSYRFARLSPFDVNVTASVPDTQVPANSEILLTGHASSIAQGASTPLSLPIAAVTVNGVSVESLDAAGNFLTQVPVLAGLNGYTVTATDSTGQSATTALAVQGVETSTGHLDFSQFADITGSFGVDYARTSFDNAARTLYADSAIHNLGQYPANVPLLVGVRNISDPSVVPLEPAGFTPDGTPYYDFTNLVTGGGALNPGNRTGSLSLPFFDPQRGQFTYDLIFLGQLNHPPAFTSVPAINALDGHAYNYAATASDPDGDPLTFSLVSGATGMAIGGQTGLVNWTPADVDLGTHDVTLRVADGRGGTADQHYTLSVTTAPPNRPPIITSTPVGTARVNRSYSYDVQAVDPDLDAIQYALLDAPQGMTIDPTTGLITWAPTAAQIFPPSSQQTDPTLPVVPGFDVSVLATVTDPVGLTFDEFGNLFVGRDDSGSAGSNLSATRIHRVERQSGLVREVGLPIDDPDSVAVDRFGTVSGVPGSVLVGGTASPGGGIITAILPTGSTEVVLGHDQSAAVDFDSLRFDHAGRLIGLDTAVNALYVVSSQGLQLLATVASARGFAGVSGFAIGPDDGIYVVGADGVVRVYNADGSLRNAELASGLVGGVLFFGEGAWGDSLYAILPSTHELIRLDSQGHATTVGTNVPIVYNAKLGPDGALYLSAFDNDQILRIAPSRQTLGLKNGEYRVHVAASDGRGGIATQEYTLCLLPDPQNHAPVIVSQPVTSTELTSPTAPVSFDLTKWSVRTWTTSTPQPPPIWVLSDNNSTATELNGANPDETVLLSDVSYANTRITGMLRVDTAGDDDAIGFVFGYQDAGHFYVFDWWQGGENATTKMRVRVINSPVAPDAALLEADSSSFATLLFRNEIGWQDFTDYGFSLEYEPGRFTITVTQGAAVVATIPITESTYTSGKVGFYGDSQPRIQFKGFAHQSLSSLVYSYDVDAADPDIDPLTYSLTQKPDGMTINPQTGTIDWIVPQPPPSVAPPVTVRVEDGRGGFDEQSFTLNATQGNGEIHGTKFNDLNGNGFWDQGNLVRNNDFENGLVDFSTDLINLSPGITEGVFVIGSNPAAYNGAFGAFGDHTSGTGNMMIINGAPFSNAAVWSQNVQVLPNTRYHFGLWAASAFPANPARIQFFVNDEMIGTDLQLTSEVGRWQFLEAEWDSGNTTSATVTIKNYVTEVWGNDFVIDDIQFQGDARPEPGLPGWIVYLDRNDNGRFDSGETSTLTDAAGNYTFRNLSSGTYTVAEVAQPGWRQTAPIDGTYVVSLDANEVVAGKDFGNQQTGDTTNHNPVFVSKGSDHTSATAGQLYRYDVVANDPDGDPLAFDLPAAPAGMTVHPTLGTLVWMPTHDQLGSFPVVLRIEDDMGGFAIQSFQVSVSQSDTAPVITSTPPDPATVGLPYEYRVTAQDAEGDAIKFSLADPAPQGAAIDATTGVLDWTPTIADLGMQHIVVVADDGRGGETQQSFDLTVAANSTNRPPLVTFNPRTTATQGRTHTALVTASDPDGDPLTFSPITMPVGMTVNADGLVTWTPTADQLGLQRAQFKVSDGRGGDVLEDFTVTVVNQETNHAPIVTSTPKPHAVEGHEYSLDLAGFDEDNDPFVWSLVTSPRGMSVGPLSGSLRWMPDDQQFGPQAVVVRIQDALGASSTQSWSIDVTCVNLAPSISSTPLTTAAVGQGYFYSIRATDPEDDPLTFTLLSAALDDMSLNPVTGLLRWNPSAARAGATVPIVIQVDDGQGNVATQSFAVQVAVNPANQPPVITSTPAFRATIGQAYVYDVTAQDPEGGALTFSLDDQGHPNGMTIGAATGVIGWTPTPDQAGVTVVTVVVRDPVGGVAAQSFTIDAESNQPPVIRSTAPSNVSAGATYRYDVRATDPDNDPLSYTLTGPDGMTIDALGRIRWAVPSAPVPAGPVSATVVVSDPLGQTASQSYSITVQADTTAPNVRLATSATLIDQQGRYVVDEAAQVLFQVQASDNVGVASLVLTVSGVALALDATGAAGYTFKQPGIVATVATATDAAGNVSTATVTLRVRDPNDADAPFVAISSPDQARTDNVASFLTDVVGSVHDDNLLDWHLDYALASQVDLNNLPVADPDWVELARGTSNVDNTRLGVFDPTLLANDEYVIRLFAEDTGGNINTRGVLVSVQGEAKLGNFHLEFTDLTVPLAGIPITITRVYDTLQANRQGDFGFGWSLGLAQADIRETVRDNGGDFFTQFPFHDGTRVFLTAPDGKRIGFTFQPDLKGTFLFGVLARPRFVPDPGVYAQLADVDVNDFALQRRADGTYGGIFGIGNYNPNNYVLTMPDGVKYAYNQTTGLRKITDRNDNTLTFTATGIFSSVGTSVLFDRDGEGRITKITDPDGHPLVYTYDARGNLVSFADQAQNTTTFSYRDMPAHYLETITDPLNRPVAKAEYDDQGRLMGVTDNLGHQTQQHFDPGQFTGTFTDANGHVTQFVYNDRGNVVSKTDAEGVGTTLYEYTDPSNPDKETKVTDPNGHATVYQYDARGNLTDTTDAAGHTTHSTYSAANLLNSTTDAAGHTTNFGYDLKGNLIQVVDATGAVRSATRDDKGRLTSVTDGKGQTTQFKYDPGCPCGSPDDAINPDGTTRHFERNTFGQVTELVDENGHKTDYVYDNLGLLRSTTDADGATTLFDYDAVGNRTLVHDADGNETRFEYDSQRHVTLETDPLGNKTRYEYDPAGNLIKETDRNGRVRQFEYDKDDRLKFETWYDVSGTLVRTIVTTYDLAGNRLSISDADATLSFTYNSLDQVETAQTAVPGLPDFTLTYHYDALGDVKSLTDNFGVEVDSTYDPRRLLTQRTWQGPGISPARVDWTYDANGQPTLVDRFTDLAGAQRSVKETIGYDSRGLTKSMQYADAVDAVFADFYYTYDPAGLVKTFQDGSQKATYGYDLIGQLTSADYSDNTIQPNEAYKYDPTGNRLTATVLGQSHIYSTGKGNQLLSDGQFTFDYDHEGNMVTKTEMATGTVTTFDYELRNRLVHVVEKGTDGKIINEERFRYDPLDRRIAVDDNGQVTNTAYDGVNVWADIDASGNVQARYLLGNKVDQLLGRQRPADGFTWYVTDKLGTVRYLADVDAAVLNHAVYDSFGNERTVTTLGLTDRFAYTGREIDTSSDMEFFRSRYYSPHDGKFLSPDSIGFDSHDTNLYRFIFNSPENGRDPTGNEAILSYLIRAKQLLIGPAVALAPLGQRLAWGVYQWTTLNLNWASTNLFGFENDLEVLEEEIVHGGFVQTYAFGGNVGAYETFLRLIPIADSRGIAAVEYYAADSKLISIQLTYVQPFLYRGQAVYGEVIRFLQLGEDVPLH